MKIKIKLINNRYIEIYLLSCKQSKVYIKWDMISNEIDLLSHFHFALSLPYFIRELKLIVI